MVVNAANILVAVRPLIVSRNKVLMGSIYKAVKNISNLAIVETLNSRLLKLQLCYMFLTTFLHTVHRYSFLAECELKI